MHWRYVQGQGQVERPNIVLSLQKACILQQCYSFLLAQWTQLNQGVSEEGRKQNEEGTDFRSKRAEKWSYQRKGEERMVAAITLTDQA